jgi:hypothetical protein
MFMVKSVKILPKHMFRIIILWHTIPHDVVYPRQCTWLIDLGFRKRVNWSANMKGEGMIYPCLGLRRVIPYYFMLVWSWLLMKVTLLSWWLWWVFFNRLSCLGKFYGWFWDSTMPPCARSMQTRWEPQEEGVMSTTASFSSVRNQGLIDQ